MVETVFKYVFNYFFVFHNSILTNIWVGSEGGVALSDVISRCTLLKKLYLPDSMFGVEVGLGLIKAISIFQNLTEIYIGYEFRISIIWKSANCSYYIPICINHQDYNQIQVGLLNGIWNWPL
ncbi:unnamed protein product [Lactuca virosa]|uniref:Uncharacterized protein n=1 Tax=Lactuca virosa TaxID=75947 RepID=A0AAU9PD81_9ASTR|nr:unnamed protein product [Lactuca virosa]